MAKLDKTLKADRTYKPTPPKVPVKTDWSKVRLGNPPAPPARDVASPGGAGGQIDPRNIALQNRTLAAYQRELANQRAIMNLLGMQAAPYNNVGLPYGQAPTPNTMQMYAPLGASQPLTPYVDAYGRPLTGPSSYQQGVPAAQASSILPGDWRNSLKTTRGMAGQTPYQLATGTQKPIYPQTKWLQVDMPTDPSGGGGGGGGGGYMPYFGGGGNGSRAAAMYSGLINWRI